MTNRRRVFATAIILVLIGVHECELVRDAEDWPICTYSMYAGLEQEWAITTNRLVGVREDGGEVPLQAARYLYPFDQSRMAGGLDVILWAPDGQRRMIEALRDVLRRYEVRRRSGAHDGPHLVGIRAYRARHELEPDANNFARPSRRQLLSEVLPG
jgi:hypothetical protein